MLLQNNLKFFNKQGDNINPELRNNVFIEIIDPQGTGFGASARAYTDFSGIITDVEIINGGINYSSSTYFKFTDAILESNIWEAPTSQLVLSPSGEILQFIVPTGSLDLNDFAYPSTYYFSNYYLPKVSAGLIESENIFVAEKVLDVNGNETYVYPRIGEYGPFTFISQEGDGTVASITIDNYVSANCVIEEDKYNIIKVPPSFAQDLKIGMVVTGVGITSLISILEVNPTIGEIRLSGELDVYGTGLTFTFFMQHYLNVGSKIHISSGPFAGIQTVTAYSDTEIYFESKVVQAKTVVNNTYSVIPVFAMYINPVSDAEWFLYEVEYLETYPIIKKSQAIEIEFYNADLASTPDTIVTLSNGKKIRQVNDILQRKPLQINFGCQADVDGIYVASIEFIDITFSYGNRPVFTTIVECEVEGEDERLGLLLENFGQEITIDQELILRESDINESNPDYLLLNRKRKEMLLQADQIWPYVGSYKGLVNIINWFGYYDLRIKEYWLNVNQDDVYYKKYRQTPITYQLKGKKADREALKLVPSKHYKKTNLFGLFYDIIRDSGNFDIFGIPETEDAFAFTNEEVLIKLFALKKYLKEKFLPLNARIVDITGEGVYYERYTVNSWNDNNDRLIIDLGKKLDFTYPKRSQIIDIRRYDPTGGLITPDLTESLAKYINRYDIQDVIISNGGGPFYGEIPEAYFTGISIQPAVGECRVKAKNINSIIIPATGFGYKIGDIITLRGGIYRVPIRIEVVSINVIDVIAGTGAVTEFKINQGPHQGSDYTSLPILFNGISVVRNDGNQYVIPTGTGDFIIEKEKIPFEVQEVTLYNLGKGYVSYPEINFLWNSAGAVSPTASLELTQYTSEPVSYYRNQVDVKKYSDAPNIPVGAIINVSTSFNVTWDELPYSWNSFASSNDASIKSWTSVLPNGTGELLAVEIINPGTQYNFAPTFTVSSESGYGATVAGQLRNGQLNIVEYTVANNIGGTILNLSETIFTNGLLTISAGRIIKGNGIPDGTIVSAVDLISNNIDLTLYDGTPVNVTINPGDKVYIHQGVYVTANGNGYTSNPLVYPNGGHGNNLYTWTEIGRGSFYQMEWKAYLSEPTKPYQVYTYESGINNLDKLTNHSFILPFTGKYTLEMIVYDLNNTVSNKIKQNAVEVFMPESDFSFVTKNVEECKDTWDEFLQIPPAKFLEKEYSPSILPDQPDPKQYIWEKVLGRWINITFNETVWNDLDVNWDTLYLTNISDVNNPIFPPCNNVDVLQISSRDILEGEVLEYRDSTTQPPEINPTIFVDNQLIRPVIDPAYDPTDWIFLRRDENIYQLEVLGADYSQSGITKIQLATLPPLDFRTSPTKWEVLREIGGTVAVAGNQIYDEETNPTGFKIGEYLKLTKSGSTPISTRNIISNITPTSFSILNGNSDITLEKPGAYGQVYKIRDYIGVNGNLNWSDEISGIKEITNISGTAIQGTYNNISQSSTTGSGSGAIFNIVGDNTGQYTVYFVHSGSGYAVGDTITILGSLLGGVDVVNDLTFDVLSLSTISSWVFLNDNPENPELYDHIGKLVLSTERITCNPLEELRPGFSQINLYAYAGTQLIYNQKFRVIHVYYDDSNVGDIYNIWGRPAYVIEVKGLTGGKLNELNANLAQYIGLGSPSIYLEYEYREFTTRERYYETASADKVIHADYNVFPPNQTFVTSTDFGPSFNANHTNWFYDHGIAGNDYSLKILNTGIWKNGVGTIVTLEDTDAELYRSDTFFTACQQSFDEDYAETHLGTRSQTWKNYQEMIWEEFCGNSWNTLDFPDTFWCNYRINSVSSNGGIKFNEYNTFNFQGILGGMTPAEKWSQALWELKNTDNPGIVKFDYSLVVKPISGFVPSGFVNDSNVNIPIDTAGEYVGFAQLNTYALPNGFYYNTVVPVNIDDIIYGEFINPQTKITTITNIGSGINEILLNKDILKKKTFIASPNAPTLTFNFDFIPSGETPSASNTAVINNWTNLTTTLDIFIGGQNFNDKKVILPFLTQLPPNAKIFIDTDTGKHIYEVTAKTYINHETMVIIDPKTINDVLLTNNIIVSLTIEKQNVVSTPTLPGNYAFSYEKNSYKLTNVIGLHEYEIRVGDYITGPGISAYDPINSPLPPKVIQLIIRGGMIREIIFDKPIITSTLNGNYIIEYITSNTTKVAMPFLPQAVLDSDIQIIGWAKNPSVDNLGYLVGTNGIDFEPPKYNNQTFISTISHTFPAGNFYKWFGFGKNKVGSFEYGLNQFIKNYRNIQEYIYNGISPIDEKGWYPANDLNINYSYSNDSAFSNYLDAKAQSNRLPYERSIGGVYTWEETIVGKNNGKIPAGSAILLTADSSDIAGKTQYFWRIKSEDKTILELLNDKLLWTFEYPGTYDVELTITDTNGNQRTKLKQSFLTIYETRE